MVKRSIASIEGSIAIRWTLKVANGGRLQRWWSMLFVLCDSRVEVRQPLCVLCSTKYILYTYPNDRLRNNNQRIVGIAAPDIQFFLLQWNYCGWKYLQQLLEWGQLKLYLKGTAWNPPNFWYTHPYLQVGRGNLLDRGALDTRSFLSKALESHTIVDTLTFRRGRVVKVDLQEW